MSVLRQLKKAVQWHDGMLLRPEHFQQADRRQEQLQHFLLSKALPFYWGVSHLRVDDVLISSGTFRILEMDAIMPDGMVVGVNAEDGDHLELDLSAYAKEFKKKKSLYIYVAVSEFRSDAASVTAEFPRYESTESGFVVNQNTGEEAPRFPCLKPHVVLMAGEEPSGRFVYFPIAKVSQEKTNFVLEPFMAPCLSVSSASRLGSLCLSMSNKVRNKATFLADQIRNDQGSILSQESRGHIRAMMASLLPFESLFQTEQAHPYELYLSLCSIAGEMSALRESEVPPAFSPYNHNRIMMSFKEVFAYIDYCLEALQEGYTIVSFAQDDRVFKADLQRSWMTDKLTIGLKGSSQMLEKDLMNWATSAVIATKDFVEGIRDKRILGAGRSLLSGSKKLKLMPSKDMILLEVIYDKSFINPDAELQIFNVGDTPLKRPREIVMYVPKEDPKKKKKVTKTKKVTKAK